MQFSNEESGERKLIKIIYFSTISEFEDGRGRATYENRENTVWALHLAGAMCHTSGALCVLLTFKLTVGCQ